jgi:predicted DNA-binding transcriptional regulator YafY
VDRVRQLTLLDERFDLPSEFDVQAYLTDEDWLQPTVQVRMRFSPQAAPEAFDDRAMWDEIEEQSDGSVVVAFGASSLEWAARVVLWRGPEVEVLEPEELRRRVAEWARAIASRYTPSE